MNAFIDDNLKGWMNKKTVVEGLEKAGYFLHYLDNSLLSNTGGWDRRDFLSEFSVFYGNVGFIRKVVEELEYTPRWIGHVPDDLLFLARREIKTEFIGDVFKSKVPKFIKPIPERGKSFDGFVYKADQLDSLYVANYFITGDEEVITSDVVNFVSEWRCYICNGEILDGKHYKGDFKIFPDYGVAETAIKWWRDAPIAWSCDLGVTDKGTTCIVECNDVMSLGMYGLASYKAAYMLEKRWEQIHKNKAI